MACPDHHHPIADGGLLSPTVTKHFVANLLSSFTSPRVGRNSRSSLYGSAQGVIYLHRIRHLEWSRFGTWLSFGTNGHNTITLLAISLYLV